MSAEYPVCEGLADLDSSNRVMCLEIAGITFGGSGKPTLTNFERACQATSCLVIIEAIQVANPTECVLMANTLLNTKCLLYDCFIQGFDSVCSANSSSSSAVEDVGSGSSSSRSSSSGSSSSGSRSAESGVWSLGAIVTVSVVIVGFLLLWWVRRCRQKQAADSYKLHQEHGTFTSTNTPTTEHATMLPLPNQVGNNVSDVLSDRVLHEHRVDAGGIMTMEFLGKGGHGIVFLVQVQKSMLLASKRLNPSHTTRQQLQRLIDEFKVASALKHTSIVEFVGVAWTNAVDLQVLYEYMAGGDLRSYLHSMPPANTSHASLTNVSSRWLPWKLQFALQIIEGLVYTHSFDPPLIHRDLKSHNVLLTESHQAKISDFGVSRFQSEVGTMTTGVGTSRWMAPEVINGGGDYTESSDIYSFGVILTELDTHAVPYDDAITQSGDGTSTVAMGSELSLMQRVGRGELRPTVSASCPSVIALLVSECLQFEPSSRPNALEIAYRLRQLAKDIQENGVQLQYCDWSHSTAR